MAIFLDAKALRFRSAIRRAARRQARDGGGRRRRGRRDHRRCARARRRGARRIFAAFRPRRSRALGLRDSAPRRSTPRSPPAIPRRLRRSNSPTSACSPITAARSRRTSPSSMRSASNSAGAGAPIESVGLYVPGGAASYPSSVLMNAAPAKVAGCARIAMVVPTPDGKVNPLVLAAARIAGVDEIYRVGGAQAIAALAYGTQTIKPVAKIVGPGNAYVAAAKRRVFGVVGIDMIAGPSEVVVLADSSADPRYRRRRPARAGRARRGRAIDPDHRRRRAGAQRRRGGVEASSPMLPRAEDRRRELARLWRDHPGRRTSPRRSPLVDRLAPEHLEIIARDADALEPKRSTTPARSSSAPIRPRRSATMSAAPITCCRLRARRAFPRASASTTSSSARRSSNATPDRSPRSGPAAVDARRGRRPHAHARSVAIRLAGTARDEPRDADAVAQAAL